MAARNKMEISRNLKGVNCLLATDNDSTLLKNWYVCLTFCWNIKIEDIFRKTVVKVIPCQRYKSYRLIQAFRFMVGPGHCPMI